MRLNRFCKVFWTSCRDNLAKLAREVCGLTMASLGSHYQTRKVCCYSFRMYPFSRFLSNHLSLINISSCRSRVFLWPRPSRGPGPSPPAFRCPRRHCALWVQNGSERRSRPRRPIRHGRPEGDLDLQEYGCHARQLLMGRYRWSRAGSQRGGRRERERVKRC